jgi:acyl-CoA thioester hydrolase
MWTTVISPRFGDTDMLGHVNNVAIATWFETARNTIFKMFAQNGIINIEDFPLLMVHSEYDFKKMIFLQPDVEIVSRVSHIGNKSFTVSHEARQNGAVCAAGSVVIVYYDQAQKASAPIPDDKRALLMEHYSE